MDDAVRLLYIHVPVAIFAYVAFITTALGSIFYLWKKSRWWDTVAHASAEIGVIFCGLTLITGSIWGRPTWNTWWEWGDVRLVDSCPVYHVFGFLALRQVPASLTYELVFSSRNHCSCRHTHRQQVRGVGRQHSAPTVVL